MKADHVFMHRRLFMAILLAAIFAATPLRAATPQQIDDAIEKAKNYLYTSEKNGNWEVIPQRDPTKDPSGLGTNNGQWGGLTAIATYALMAAGDDPQSAHVHPAIEWLKQANMVGVYSLAMRCEVWNLWYYADRKNTQVRPLVEHDGTILLNSIKTQGAATGLYDYWANTPGPGVRWVAGGRWDDSVAQYGVLGVWACADIGFEAPLGYWKLVEDNWFKNQSPAGAWRYNDDGGVYSVDKATMAAAGIATLFITQDYLHGNEGIDCTGNITNAHIKSGLDWMNKNFAQIFKDEGEACYGLYGIERIGAASGYKYFGTTEWFREGADFLVKRQGAAGAWDGRGGDVANAALGIIFLERGRAPVMMNKLQYEIDQHGDAPKLANWNQRPRDAANLAKWWGKESEGFFNWQIVNLKVPSEQLHDSPILYIAGNQTLDFTPDEIVKLRTFCEDGGLIVVNADCGARSHGFLQSVLGPKGLGAKLFGDYEFRQLPKDHLIFSNELHIGVKSQWIEVQGLSNGTRELMLVFPNADPARFWQTATYGGRETMHDIMANIYLYVTDKLKPLTKDQTYLVLKDPAIQTTQSLKVARLQYPGNWNPEPGGWRRMAAVLHNGDKIDLTCETVNLGDGKLGAGYKVADLTGTTKFHLTPAQQDELKKFVDGGGTLIVDAAGGTTDFAAAAEKELAAVFGDQATKDLTTPLPATDALFTGNGKKIESFGFRSYAMKRLPTTSHEPRLRAIKVKNRNAVYYSPEDLSVGMVGQQVDGIYGYTPATATAIMEHILVQSAAAPAAQP